MKQFFKNLEIFLTGCGAECEWKRQKLSDKKWQTLALENLS
jgi:hypothetical protein